MDFFDLAPGEELTREWKYAKQELKKFFTKETTEHSLIVTNQRVIHITKNKTDFVREELRKEDICACTAGRSNKPKELGFFLMGLGMLLFVCCFIFYPMTDGQAPWFGLCVLGIIVGIVVFLIGLFSFLGSGYKFEVRIYIQGAYIAKPTTMVAAYTGFRKVKKIAGQVKIEVNRAAVEEIVNTFGTLVLANR